jgi:F0F1-type ATP synthase assembly protein I
MMSERIWIMLAAGLVIVAAAFLWRNNVSAAFVTATLGAVAWFLSYRVQMHAKLAAAEEDPREQEPNETSDEK